jgi:hypothetical protein
MNKIDHFIGLNRTGRHFIGKLEEELKKTFAGDAKMLDAIEASKKEQEAFDYEKVSAQPDEERAIRIARKESCSLLYGNDVIELIVRVCRLPNATAKDIVKTHFSFY